jgi:hypothetical protein
MFNQFLTGTVLLTIIAALLTVAVMVARRFQWHPWLPAGLLGLSYTLLGSLFRFLPPFPRSSILDYGLACATGLLLLAAGHELRNLLQEGPSSRLLTRSLGYVLLTGLGGGLACLWVLPSRTWVNATGLFLVSFGGWTLWPRSEGNRDDWGLRLGTGLWGLLAILLLTGAPSSFGTALPVGHARASLRALLLLAGLGVLAFLASKAQAFALRRWVRWPWLRLGSGLLVVLLLTLASTGTLGTALPGWWLAGLAMHWEGWRPAEDGAVAWSGPDWLPLLAGAPLALLAGLNLSAEALRDAATWQLASLFAISAAIPKFFLATWINRSAESLKLRWILPSGLLGLAYMQILIQFRDLYPGVLSAAFIAWLCLEFIHPVEPPVLSR